MVIVKSEEPLSKSKLEGLCNELNDQVVLLKINSKDCTYLIEGIPELDQSQREILKKYSLK